MATKKPPSKSKVKPKASASRLENLAARPTSLDETIDEQGVDHSGVFRVTSEISRAQIGHDEESLRFPSDSLVMAAQRDGFRDDGPTLVDVVEESVADDEATAALRRQRLATLAARAQTRRRR
jgi:hypothetical protein